MGLWSSRGYKVCDSCRIGINYDGRVVLRGNAFVGERARGLVEERCLPGAAVMEKMGMWSAPVLKEDEEEMLFLDGKAGETIPSLDDLCREAEPRRSVFSDLGPVRVCRVGKQ